MTKACFSFLFPLNSPCSLSSSCALISKDHKSLECVCKVLGDNIVHCCSVLRRTTHDEKAQRNLSLLSSQNCLSSLNRQLTAITGNSSALYRDEVHHNVVEICSASCCNNTSHSHFILLYTENLHMPSMHTNKKCLRMMNDKRKLGQRGCAFRSEVINADAWILALIGVREATAHCTNELKRLRSPVALSFTSHHSLDLQHTAKLGQFMVSEKRKLEIILSHSSHRHGARCNTGCQAEVQ